MNNQNKIVFVVFCLILFFISIFIVYKVIGKRNNVKNSNDIVQIKEEKIDNDNYDYKITNRATDYEKELFNELENIVSAENILYEDYANVLVKIFVADLFTLKNKKSSSDVRCSQYVYDKYQETFKLMVKESIYSHIELDLDGSREQKLPVVKNVIVNSINNEEFVFDNKVLDEGAFNINVSIEYVEDMGYPNSYNVVLINKDKKLQVVKTFE